MSINIETDDGVVEVYLSGEIDHHSAGELRERIDEAIGAVTPQRVILDFRGVTFMDSSGIGLVMGRYKLLEGTGAVLELRGLSSPVKRVMRLAGLDRIAVMDGGTKK
ncbi:STAS domain-containing protein [Clostridiaceae bacterium NSJ-31]|uniref:Anti-sigma factor antagonist n=1 Tax=Ligaoa zhengdingensis TaxID=2763658 RepID=A0A926HZP6_9FIRM|nr:STAS domain-containing protein [Ligaoa zhengdingensis]MBC8546152.1 STAS domain-containing protein [Ligaoa zhengdingensis]